MFLRLFDTIMHLVLKSYNNDNVLLEKHILGKACHLWGWIIMESLEVKLGLEELEPMEAFWKTPCEYNLSRISKKLHTPEMLEAIFNNPEPDPRGLKLLLFVSKRLITRDVCKKAVLRDERNIYEVPPGYIDEDFCAFMSDHHISLRFFPVYYRTKELCEKAVAWDWKNLAYVPSNLKEKKLCDCALKQNLAAIKYLPARFVTPELAMEAVRKSDYIINEYNDWKKEWPISFIPSEVRTDEMIDISLSLFPESVETLPTECMTEERVVKVLQRKGSLLRYIPGKYRSKNKIINVAIKQDPTALYYVPDGKKTHKLCDSVFERIKNEPEIRLSIFPKQYIEEYKELYKQTQPVFHAHQLRLMTGEEQADKVEQYSQAQVMKTGLTVYNVALSESETTQRIYYISDLHLEHQLDLDNKPLSIIEQMIEEKVQELISDVPDTNCTLLVAGDVSAGEKLTNMFYRSLRLLWKGEIIYVLGNHELWDMYSETERVMDEVISQFREDSNYGNLHILENELLVYYKGEKWATIKENDILDASLDDLKSICDKSLLLVLGGNGFSGCNPKYNADMGLYRDKLSRIEEIERSERFRNIHDKLMACLADNRLIVLTHTPPEDWTIGKLCSGWIYVNGHSHHNRYEFKDNAPCILADNQIGYKPRIWHLKCFERECRMRYDPLAYLQDGIHEISAHQYTDFNRCAGIAMYDFKRQGNIYAIKRNGVYMFIYENRKTSILAGGGLRTGYHDKLYYYDHMPMYISKLHKLFSKYYGALSFVSEAVQKIGGSGRIHGSIVDIDFFNHLYLDPRDGKVKPYYADNMKDKVFYEDVYHLVEQSPCMFNREMYLKRLNGKQTELKSLLLANSDTQLARLPEVVFDTAMYKDSREMRAVQYVMEQNVIRFWNDEILTYPV